MQNMGQKFEQILSLVVAADNSLRQTGHNLYLAVSIMQKCHFWRRKAVTPHFPLHYYNQ